VRCDRSATTLKHPDTAHDMSITDLAAASGVAESTVSRFVQAIGVTTAGIKHARSR
jgi:DNA-binding MurR/RpiR family transcriptional regulator